MKKILLLLVSTILLGCENTHRDCSVFDELDLETLSEAKDDSLFIQLYSGIEEVRIQMNNLPIETKVKYANVTYRDILKTMEKYSKMSDKEKYDIFSLYSKEWEKSNKDESEYEYTMKKVYGEKAGGFMVLFIQLAESK